MPFAWSPTDEHGILRQRMWHVSLERVMAAAGKPQRIPIVHRVFTSLNPQQAEASRASA